MPGAVSFGYFRCNIAKVNAKKLVEQHKLKSVASHFADGCCTNIFEGQKGAADLDHCFC